MVRAAIVLIVMAVICGCASVALTVVASDLQMQLNAYYTNQAGADVGADGGPASSVTQDELNALSTLSYSLSNLTPPVMSAAVVAVFAALTVLAVRWQRRESYAEDATSADDAASASDAS
jgi:hypothetical protein